MLCLNCHHVFICLYVSTRIAYNFMEHTRPEFWLELGVF
jgi:hypothetical protein